MWTEDNYFSPFFLFTVFENRKVILFNKGSDKERDLPVSTTLCWLNMTDDLRVEYNLICESDEKNHRVQRSKLDCSCNIQLIIT